MKKISLEKELKILSSKAEDILPHNSLEEKLVLARKEKRPLRIKLGVDPTAPDLHLGHLVILRKLKEFQDFGHRVVIIIGDFTAQIGDPSGRNKVRPPLSKKEIKKNTKTYLEQIGKVLDLRKIEITMNGKWLRKLSLESLIRLMSKFTVAQILARDDFRNRFDNKTEIFLHELIYPILQGYDSKAVRADIEMGGTDQKFNLLVGRDIQEIFNLPPQAVMTMPLIEGTDGKRKMSKSYGNYIAFNERPEDKYGKIMSVPDSLILKYFRLLTNISEKSLKKYERLLKSGRINPKELKMKLAFDIVSNLDGENPARKARKYFVDTFQKGIIPRGIPILISNSATVNLPALLVENGVLSSKSEARRIITQGGIKIDGDIIGRENVKLSKKEALLQVGKRRFFKILRK